MVLVPCPWKTALRTGFDLWFSVLGFRVLGLLLTCGGRTLNAFTGAKLWSYKTGDVIYSSPTVANGVVYVGSLDGNIYGLNASTGDSLWSYTTGDFVESSPTVVNGTVYVGSLDGHAYAFGLDDRYWAKRDRAKRPPTVAPPSLRELVPNLSLTVAVPLGPSRTH